MAIKDYTTFPKAPALLEPQYLEHSLGEGRGLSPLQRSSLCILQPQPTGKQNQLIIQCQILFLHISNIRFLNEYFVYNILNYQELICLHMIKFFQV